MVSRGFSSVPPLFRAHSFRLLVFFFPSLTIYFFVGPLYFVAFPELNPPHASSQALRELSRQPSVSFFFLHFLSPQLSVFQDGSRTPLDNPVSSWRIRFLKFLSRLTNLLCFSLVALDNTVDFPLSGLIRQFCLSSPPLPT